MRKHQCSKSSNYEYNSEWNFCPFCGERIKEEPYEDLDSFENLTDEELTDLIEDDYRMEDEQKSSYISTYEYYIMLLLRTEGIKIKFEEANKYLRDMEDQFMYFDEKYPYNFTDEEIIEHYKRWLTW